jgi:hypothetical protein
MEIDLSGLEARIGDRIISCGQMTIPDDTAGRVFLYWFKGFRSIIQSNPEATLAIIDSGKYFEFAKLLGIVSVKSHYSLYFRNRLLVPDTELGDKFILSNSFS